MKQLYEDALQPILPKKFDENEWFTLAITVFVSACVYYITVKHRELLWTEIICISLLNLQLTTIGDYFLAMPPYDLYDTVDRNSGEAADIFLQNIVYPGFVLFLMHWYKTFSPNKGLFIIGCATLLTVLECVSVYGFRLFTYKGWKLSYSAMFYVMIMWINVVFFERMARLIRQRQRDFGQG
jgi:hypothetical protein